MKKRPIVMYLGGFAKVGGIEAFARDFLLAIAATYPERELVMWGKSGKDHRLLNDIVDSGAKISRSPWRWGCLWNLPDFILAPIGLKAVRGAASVIFKRPPPLPILRLLRQAGNQTGRRIPFILITPYRPAEYWGDSPASSQFKDFDVITVQSEEGIHDLEKFGYRGRIENIPLLPPESARPVDYPASRGGGTIRLGFLGRMAAQKNLGYLLEIYQVLTQKLERDNRYELHLFGDGRQREELKRRCASLALQNVVFHGETPRSEVARVIDTCDIFLNTSLTEGQCLVALEVLSRGRPLIATPVGALPEVLRQSELGRLAPLGDPGAFAAAVVEVAHAIRAGRMTPQSVVAAFKIRYDYEAVLKRYLDLLAGADSTAPINGEMPPQVSIMITTKNRVHDLQRTCRVLRQLSPPPLEILITADGCTDGTVDFIKSELPHARLFVHRRSRGSIAARDRMIREARGDLVLSLDDDSYPQESDCIAKIVPLFEQRPQLAVLHFPQCTDEYPGALPRFDFGLPRLTRSFSSAGAVVRRSTYLRLRGFEPSFFHAYEEPDYALQCVAAGREIFYNPSVSIRHHYSGTARNEMRTHHRHARNEFWSTLMRCPFPHVLGVAAYRFYSQFRYACSRGLGWAVREPIWWAQAVAGIPHCLGKREPVSWTDYKRWLRLPEISYPPVGSRHGGLKSEAITPTKTA